MSNKIQIITKDELSFSWINGNTCNFFNIYIKLSPDKLHFSENQLNRFIYNLIILVLTFMKCLTSINFLKGSLSGKA